MNGLDSVKDMMLRSHSMGRDGAGKGTGLTPSQIIHEIYDWNRESLMNRIVELEITNLHLKANTCDIMEKMALVMNQMELLKQFIHGNPEAYEKIAKQVTLEDTPIESEGDASNQQGDPKTPLTPLLDRNQSSSPRQSDKVRSETSRPATTYFGKGVPIDFDNPPQDPLQKKEKSWKFSSLKKDDLDTRPKSDSVIGSSEKRFSAYYMSDSSSVGSPRLPLCQSSDLLPTSSAAENLSKPPPAVRASPFATRRGLSHLPPPPPSSPSTPLSSQSPATDPQPSPPSPSPNPLSQSSRCVVKEEKPRAVTASELKKTTDDDLSASTQRSPSGLSAPSSKSMSQSTRRIVSDEERTALRNEDTMKQFEDKSFHEIRGTAGESVRIMEERAAERERRRLEREKRRNERQAKMQR